MVQRGDLSGILIADKTEFDASKSLSKIRKLKIGHIVTTAKIGEYKKGVVIKGKCKKADRLWRLQ